MGDNLISGKFVSTFQISTQDLDTPISLKMAVKRTRSTINYKSQPLIQVVDETSDTNDALVCSLENYDIFLGMPYLTAHNAIIDCENAIITFPKTGVTLTCKKAPSAKMYGASDTSALHPDASDVKFASCASWASSERVWLLVASCARLPHTKSS